MEMKGKKILVLGGWGLVGMAICRKLIKEEPQEIIISSLEKWQSDDAVAQLSKLTDVKLTPVWGNIFVRHELKDLPRNEILENDKYRRLLMEDVLNDLSPGILKESFLFQIIDEHKPDVIVDSINSATALAYQDIFRASIDVRKKVDNFNPQEEFSGFKATIEKFLTTQYVPQLIRHIQILYEAMRQANSKVYLKIGTSGTGGMGLNIPYTHSEEKPSRVLLSKAAIAGAQTLLLWLMARTPDAPIIKEVKPTAAIAWKKIEFGEIKRRGAPVKLYDCPADGGMQLQKSISLRQQSTGCWEDLNDTFKSVFIDTGENGIFSRGEFTAITSRGQMEFVTPEEIANNVLYEIKGGNTGHDIINALDNATMGPTYRAGYLRQSALGRMKELEKEHNVRSVAFELLGPPRLSKLLYEVSLLSNCCGTMEAVLKMSPAELSKCAEENIRGNKHLRSQIISIGIPILMSDGKTLLRGPEMKIPAYHGEYELEVTPENIDKWTFEGWVDLREQNFALWQKRLRLIQDEIDSIPDDETSSRLDRDRVYWSEDSTIDPGKVCGWLFLKEEEGLRMKE
jgi:hypothetical protein